MARVTRWTSLFSSSVVLWFFVWNAAAQDGGVPSSDTEKVSAVLAQDSKTTLSGKTKAETGAKQAGLLSLNKQHTVLLDRAQKRLLLKAKVVLREGPLEMLCCLKNTKEHESILAVEARAYVIHTGLLALNAQPGTPVRFVPEYTPPTGQTINIFLKWVDPYGKPHRAAAQTWVRYAIWRFYVAQMDALPAHVKIGDESQLRFDAENHELTWYGPMTKVEHDRFRALSRDQAFRDAIDTFYRRSQPRQMTAYWVFAGSGLFEDEESGQKYYQAEGGDLICVANFSSATIDVAARSSSSGQENLMFEAYTERIPPLGTSVTIELIPETGKTKSRAH